MPLQPTYLSPDDRYRACVATPWRRVAAGAIDWGLCYLVCLLASIPLGVLDAFGRTLNDEGDSVLGSLLVVVAQALVVAPAVAYLAGYAPSAQTLGMRALEIFSVRAATGRAPALRWRALLRALLAVPFALAVVNAVMDVISAPPPGGYSVGEERLLAASWALVAVGLLTKLPLVLDRGRRTAQDRLFGLVVLEEVEPLHPVRASYWGYLDAVDLQASAPGKPPAARGTM